MKNFTKFLGRNRSWMLKVLLVVLGMVWSIEGSGQIAQRGSATTGFSSTTSNNTTPTTFTINKPTGVVAGDVMFASIVTDPNNNGPWNYPTITGWIKVTTSYTTDKIKATLLYRVADGTEGASFTVSVYGNTAATGATSGSIVAFYGVDVNGGLGVLGSGTGPFDNTTGTFTAGTSTIAPTSITTTKDNSAILFFSLVANDDLTHSGWTCTSPGSLTEIVDYGASSGWSSVGVAWGTKTTAGATGNGSVTLSSGSYYSYGIMISLKGDIFYSNNATPNTAAQTLANWNSKRDGTGSAPSDFTTSGRAFVVQSGHKYQATSTWTGSSTSTITVESGGALDVNAQSLSTWQGVNIAGTGVSTSGALLNSSASAASLSIPITLKAAATITSSGSGGLNLTGNIVNGGFLLTVDGANATTISTGIISGTGGITKTGAGTLTLSGANTYTGATTISSGILSAGTIVVASSASNIGNATSAVVLGDGSNQGTLSYTGAAASYTRGFTVSAGGGKITNTTANLLTIATGTIVNSGALTLTNSSTGGTTISSVISGTGSLVVNNSGAGVTTLSGANSYTGTTTISAGTLSATTIVVSGTSNLGNATSAVVLGDGSNQGTLSYTGAAASYTRGFTVNAGGGKITNTTANLLTIATGGIANSGALTLTNSSTGGTTISSIISGAGSLVVDNSGAGVTTLSGVNTYTGVTTVSTGTLTMGNNAALGNASAGTTVASGAALNIQTTTTSAEPLTISGTGYSSSGAVYTSGTGTFTGVITLGASSTINATTSLTLTGGIVTASGKDITFGNAGTIIITTAAISGGGNLVKSGAGTTRVSFACTYTGTTTINAGRLENGASDVFPGTQLILSGGTYGNALVGASSTAYTETFGTLQLNSSSTIDFATTSTSQNILFSASNDLTWVGTLTITDWTGASCATATYGKLFIGTTSSGCSNTQLYNQIYNSVYNRFKQLSTGEVVPCEEVWYSSNGTATNANLLTNWYSANNGTGSNPTSWDGDFYVQDNHTMKLTADWGTGATGVRLFLQKYPLNSTSGVIDLNGFKIKSDIAKLGVFSSNTFTNTSGTAGTIEEDIVLSGATTIVNAGNVTVSGGISGAFALTASGTGTTTISGIIATGAGSIVKAGTGTLTLSGNNTFSGGVSWSTTTSNQININHNNALGTGTLTVTGTAYATASSNRIDNTSGSTVTIPNAIAIGGSIAFVGSNALTQTTGGIASTTACTYTVVANTLTLGGVISGANSYIKEGVGTMILSGNSTFTSTLTISAGTLKLGATGTSPNGPLGTTAAATTVSSGAVLDLNGYTLATAEALTLNGAGLTGAAAGALTNTGGAATYSGAITLGSSGATITATTSGTLTCSGAVGGNTYALTLDGASGATGTMSGVIGTTSGTVTKNGAGTWTLSGANTFTGQTTVAAGTLKLGANGSGINGPLGTVSGNTSVTAGAVLDLNGFTLVTAEPLTLNGAGLTALAAGALTNTGSAATYSGNITLGSSGATITATTSGTLTCSGTVTGNTYALTLDGAASSSGTMSGAIQTTSGTVTKNGAGTWTFGNASTNYTGATLISAGTLKLSNVAALGTSSATTVSSGAVLDLNGITLSSARPLTLNGTGLTASPAGALTNSGADASYSGNITLGSASTITATSSGTLTCSGTVATGAFGLTLDGAAGTGTMSGVLSTPNSLTKNGAGTWVLSGINTYTGITTVSTGTLKLSGSGSIASTSSIVVASAATFDVSATTGATTLGSATIFSIPSTGANTTSTVNSASGKALTLGSTGGITFSDYGGANGSNAANAPLTVTGTSGSIALASAPVTVTTSTALAAGTYVLIANSGATGVTGTPGALTIGGSGYASGGSGSLAVTSNQLVLTVVTTPVIQTSGTLSAFTACSGIVSSEQSFTVSGTNLSANLVVTPPTGYEVCETSGGTFTSSLSFTPSSGTVTSKTVYVRTTTSATNGASGNIACTSTSVTTQNVATGSAIVTTAPNAGTLSGTEAICSNGTTTFVSNGNSGGAFTSATTAAATIDASTGVITPVAAGSSLITYTVTGTGGCSNATATRTVTVTTVPNAGTLSGTEAICSNGTTTFVSNGDSGGAFTSATTATATVNSSTGVITPVAAGSSIITYTVTGTGGCSNATATRTVTVTTAPNAGTLSGTEAICSNGTTTFVSNGNSGGAFTSATTAAATVNASTGVITPVAAGSSLITYTVTGTGGCSNATATRTVTVTTAPNAGTLSGTEAICSNGTTTFVSNGNSGGAFTSATTAAATVNASTGVITPVAAGSSLITYTVTGTGGCSNATATRTVTVTTAPNAGTLSGTEAICSNGTTTFVSNGNSGGAFTSATTAAATVNASTGIITPVAAGSSLITYTVTGTGGCSNATATRTVTVTTAPNAGTLSGTEAICSNGTTTFVSNGNSGGAFTSATTAAATVNASTGIITPVAAGSSLITYTVTGTGGCSNATATRTVTVTTAPNAGTLSGTEAICSNGTTTFVSNGNSGGAFTSATTAAATVNASTGVITPVAAGSSIITYTVTGTGGCSNATVTRTVTVTTAPNAGTLSGTEAICSNGTTTFVSNGDSGGAFTSATTAAATVNSSTGVITPVAAGSSLITYTVTGTGGCSNATATRTVTVTTAPNAGTLSGTEAICSNGTTTFVSNGNSGGAFTSATTAAATVNSSTGVITPVAAGSSIITYTVTGTGGCSNATATRTVTVTTAPNAGTLSGTEAICSNGTTTFVSNGNSGGAFTSATTAAATIDASTGVITPVAAGSSLITYTVTGTGGCSNATATRTVTVTTAPNAGTLSGTEAICSNGTTTFVSNGNSGGAFTSATTAAATVNASTGVITPVAAGSSIITYTVTGTGGCSNATVTRTVTVTTAPNAGTLSGTEAICSNGTTTFVSNGDSGGAFTSATTAAATVNSSTGVITPVAAGSSLITYTVTGTGGCSNATATRTVTVTTAPNAGTLSGTEAICSNGTTTFVSNGNSGGAFTSATTAAATVNASTGVITPVAAGSSIITYTVTGTGGCSNATVTRTVTVTALPTASISYAGTPFTTSQGAGQAVSLTGTSGGAYSSAAGLTIDASTGSLTPSSSTVGTYTVTYTIASAGGCNAVTATTTVVINSGVSTFYYDGLGSMATITNWGSNTDGTGTNPTSMILDGITYYVNHNVTATPSNDAAWTLGSGSKIVVGNGTNATNFSITSGNTITGTIDVANNATLTIAASTAPTLGTIDAGSSVLFTASSGTLTIPAKTYGNLTLSNSSGKTAGGAITVNGTLALSGGSKLTLNANNLTIGSSGFFSGYDASNFIVTNSTGKVIQNSIGPDGVLGPVIGKNIFPVGISTTSYTPIQVNNTGTSDDFSVRVAEDRLANGTSGAASGMHAVDRTWFVEEANAGNSNVSMIIQWNAAEELTPTGNAFNRTNCFISHYTGGTWDRPTAGAALGSGPYTISRSGITSFSPFAVEDPLALPITLIDFTTKVEGKKVRLDWVTGTEENNDFFTMERSLDGENFEQVFTKKGAGNSKVNQYYFGYDTKPYAGVSYYRLKQTDFDGKFAYSDIVSVKVVGEQMSAEMDVQVYPNPVTNQLIHVDLKAQNNGTYTMHMVNEIGQEVFADTYEVVAGENKFEIQLPTVVTGIYMLEIRNQNETLIDRVKVTITSNE